MAHHWGLNAKLMVVLLAVISSGMILIDTVHLAHLRQQRLGEVVTRGRIVAAAAIERLNDHVSPVGASLQTLLDTASISCAYLYDRQQTPLIQGLDCLAPLDITDMIRDALDPPRPVVRTLGSTWAVYWFGPQFMVMIEPVAGDGAISAICLVQDLTDVYIRLRNEQAGVIGYIAINTLVLTLLAGYRLWRLLVRPIEQLALRSEAVRSDSDSFFHLGNDASVFGRLSLNLNRLIGQMAEDKANLRHTVVALQNANADLQQAQQDMLRAETLAAVGRLSSGIAHEIGNPIGIIFGYMDLLRSGDLSQSERTDYIDRMQAEVTRIHDIIRQLLDYARTESRVLTEASVHELIREMVSGLTTQPMWAGLDIRCDLRAQADCVRVDFRQLRQVLLNLLINAADAIASVPGAEAGRIHIATQVETAGEGAMPFLSVSVTDSGPGMEPDLIDKVFEPFFTTKAPGKGTGLGLWVSAMMIEQFQGRMIAGNSPDGGGRFEIRLPLAGRSPDAPASALEPRSGANTNGEPASHDDR